MSMRYTVVSLDRDEKTNERIGHIGEIESQGKLLTNQIIAIDGQMYYITDAERKGLAMIYVTKVQSLKLQTTEYESDVAKQPLQIVAQFLKRHNIVVKDLIAGESLQARYRHPGRVDKDIVAAGADLSFALLNLRNEMINRGIIERGEW